jgi:AcrR family transcriptional regulator
VCCHLSKILPGTNNGRYDEVLAVAARLIAKNGFERASGRSIARESTLSQEGLYYYFSSQEDFTDSGVIAGEIAAMALHGIVKKNDTG